MKDPLKTTQKLLQEMAALKQRIEELELSEAKHRRTEEALRDSEERFRSLVEATSDWIWEIDNEGFYIYASPKIKDLLGYEPEEVIGKTYFDLMPKDRGERIIQLFMKILESRRPFSGLENTITHKDGREITLETSGVPVIDDQGNFLGYRGFVRDITERKRTGEALRKGLYILMISPVCRKEVAPSVKNQEALAVWSREFFLMWSGE